MQSALVSCPSFLKHPPRRSPPKPTSVQLHSPSTTTAGNRTTGFLWQRKHSQAVELTNLARELDGIFNICRRLELEGDARCAGGRDLAYVLARVRHCHVNIQHEPRRACMHGSNGCGAER
eukprot:5385-Pleurochrysis_carterae.AAC.1